jgi:hypothetical protein
MRERVERDVSVTLVDERDGMVTLALKKPGLSAAPWQKHPQKRRSF